MEKICGAILRSEKKKSPTVLVQHPCFQATHNFSTRDTELGRPQSRAQTPPERRRSGGEGLVTFGRFLWPY